MSRDADFVSALQAAMERSPGIDGDDGLKDFLQSRGFAFAARSATNLRLLAQMVPVQILHNIAETALSTPTPDMALNGLERIGSSVPREDLLALCERPERLAQLLAVCGSSSFLTINICREPCLFRSLFGEGGIETGRNEEEMLAALRALVDDETGHQELFPILRRFKVAEVLRIAARDLNGLATLEEVTAELSALASAVLQIACEVTRRSLVAEYGIPFIKEPEGDVEAELTVIGMGKFGGRELNFSSDIDIIYIYSSDQGETTGIDDGLGGRKGMLPLHTFFVRMAEMVTRVVSQVTEDGFAFRVDLGLRPEG
ncbi:MAG TPA: bifunctional [glutamate--ammonia ligase]-adenylyl-L-tyrosine phosphorylase/[glutamate--ammonia-ligase] adenylyltransferase, partial [Geobacteraceae bacterium]|nr:bifunctional [glutamate--ammonia ligase]-adenylyl-L-tyrosine phosphorylase/[glutamate--ammonia-ligase] adenylyltransferase [Geobacteraceae bacterium]